MGDWLLDSIQEERERGYWRKEPKVYTEKDMMKKERECVLLRKIHINMQDKIWKLEAELWKCKSH